tara:strand:- start:4087 stop:4611 length:525 start_codon:yes stop_codon:yes gene_type:complete
MPVPPPADPASQRRVGFAPVVDDRTQLLILGSLPGNASLAAGQYYGHPRNGFWRLTGGVIGRDLVDLDYPQRLEALTAAGVGLWDVITTARRTGSLDAAIRDPAFADLTGLIATLPQLRAIGFNGATAARAGRRSLAGADDGLVLIDLPSSSPAYTLPLADKARVWTRLGEFIA